MLAKESLLRHVDPGPVWCPLLPAGILEQSKIAPIAAHEERWLPTRPVTRIRRAGAVALGQVDRLPAAEASLAEHLSQQLRMLHLAPRELALANWMVWNLDQDGYLREDLSEVGAMTGADIAELGRALALVQALEPAGVGARSLRECLLLQLRAQADLDAVAIQLVDGHLKTLAEKRYDDLARALSQPLDRILQALAAIRRLEPRPGRPFGAVQAHVVRPAATIEKAGDVYRVVLRDDDTPPVKGPRWCWAEAATAEGAARDYLVHRLRVASSLIGARERRRQTVRGVVESIVRRQPGFLEHGPNHLRPLSIREVARDVGVHESTVSRTVAHRYVDTPHGVFPLHSFFSNRLPGDPAGLVSPLAVRQRIRTIVEAEDPGSPLADGTITGMLAIAGIRIARRTVVKYRSLLGIPAAPVRRSLAA